MFKKVYIKWNWFFWRFPKWQQELLNYDPSPILWLKLEINNDGLWDIATTCFGNNKPSAYINNGNALYRELLGIDNSYMIVGESYKFDRY